MATSTTIIVRDPADPYDLFDIARQLAGDVPRWREHDFGAVRMLQTDSGQGAAAQVSVHYAADLSRWNDDDNPEGFAVVLFTTSGGDYPRERHERMAGDLLNCLAARGVRAAWRFEDSPWMWS
ncbi:MAG TPA: hypothetical protein VFQ68_46070 [Streptosporangiaceae bacterium]|nr:hypothetical protein [Streptosporangiaceae bacterium]